MYCLNYCLKFTIAHTITKLLCDAFVQVAVEFDIGLIF